MTATARLSIAALCLVALTLLAALSAAPAIALCCGVIGAVATLLALPRAAPPGDTPPAAAAPVEAPPPGRLLDGVDLPALLIDGPLVAHANPAARALLGPHVVGEDVRVAIRHPAAAAALAGPLYPVRGLALDGLGRAGSRWELAVTPLDGDTRLAVLTDQSAMLAAEAMRVDFVANASHELRTPLTTLSGFIETLADPSGPDDVETRTRFLGIMAREAQRMSHLVEDLISLSRIEAERHRAPDTSLDLGPLLTTTIESIRVAAGEPRETFRLDLAPDVPPIAGDQVQLSQVIHNIVGNALKYRRPGTPVNIALDRAAGTVRLTVTDRGEGIAAEHLPRLTERFYRVDAGRSRAVGGTGLGLAIVKHIVDRHRGRLAIASTPGTGTTVTITLPVLA